MDTVAITKCQNYSKEEVYARIQEVADASAFPDVKGKRVLVKPNILSDSPVEKGITTNPQVVAAVIRLCQERGAGEVLVGDSPGLHTPHFSARSCGIAAVCEESGARWVDFSDSPVTKNLDNGESVHIARVLDEVDMTISVAKFKTHQLMYTTGAVKNLFGIMPGLNKSPMHLRHPSREDFAAFITSLFSLAKVSYAFIDGIIAMEGAGPANGTLRHLGLLMGGADAYLVDKAQAIIMGYDWRDIPVLAAAQEKGHSMEGEVYSILDAHELTVADFQKIDVDKPRGLFSSLILPFFTRGLKRRKEKMRPAPRFDDAKCVHCLRCMKICPAKALSHSDRIEIDTHKCIRCYCCAEMCPADAIEVEG